MFDVSEQERSRDLGGSVTTLQFIGTTTLNKNMMLKLEKMYPCSCFWNKANLSA